MLAAQGDPRQVVTDPEAGYFGTLLQDAELVPSGESLLTPTRFADWPKA